MVFGFRRKKLASSGIQENAAVTTPALSGGSCEITFDEPDFQAVLRAYFRPGNFAAIYYAKCCGMKGDTLQEANTDVFFRSVLFVDPERIDAEGKKVGYEFFEREVTASLSSNYMEMHWAITPTDGENLRIPRSDLERLRIMQQYCKKQNITKLDAIFSNIDMVSKVFHHVECLRNNDIELILSELRKRKKAVKKLFRPLRNNRVNKFGDEDLGPEYTQLDELFDYAFTSDDFFFFWQVKPRHVLLDYIDGILNEGIADNAIPIDGIEFEHWCADQLRKQGWDVAVSRVSGDQGVDVMVRRDGVEVAIQCKRYSNPIGNKAVQEVFTGAQNEGAGHSCVIGTGGFTASAKQIAKATGVHLIDASDLGSFSDIFGFTGSPPLLQEEDNDDLLSDEPTLIFSTSGQGGGYIGTLLRSLLKTSGPQMYDLDPRTGETLLQALDAETGEGAFEVTRSSFGALLVLGAYGLKSPVQLTDENIESMLGSPFYDEDSIQTNSGMSVLMRDILSLDVARDAHQFLIDKTTELGSLIGPKVRQELQRILAKSG